MIIISHSRNSVAGRRPCACRLRPDDDPLTARRAKRHTLRSHGCPPMQASPIHGHGSSRLSGTVLVLLLPACVYGERRERDARAHGAPDIHPLLRLSQSFRGGNLCHGRLSQSCNCPALFHVQCSAQSQTVRQLKREAFFTTQTFASTCAYHAHTLQAGSMLS